METLKRIFPARVLAALFAVHVFMLPAACSLYRNDRCFVEDDMFELAENLFIESGSLDLVERQLTGLEWRRCEINETLYRISKQFEVVK